MAGGAGAAGGMGASSAANNTMPSFGTPAPGSGIGQISGNTLSNMANPTGVNNGTMGSGQMSGLSANPSAGNPGFTGLGSLGSANGNLTQALGQLSTNAVAGSGAGNPGFPDPRYSSQGGTGTNFAQTLSQLGMGGMASRGGTPVPPQMQQGGPPMTYGQPGGMMQRPPMTGGFGDMIKRRSFSPMMGQASGYGAPRPLSVFQPGIQPQRQTRPSFASQNADMDKMRQELDSLRAWRDQQQNPGGNGNSN